MSYLLTPRFPALTGFKIVFKVLLSPLGSHFLKRNIANPSSLVYIAFPMTSIQMRSIHYFYFSSDHYSQTHDMGLTQNRAAIISFEFQILKELLLCGTDSRADASLQTRSLPFSRHELIFIYLYFLYSHNLHFLSSHLSFIAPT